MNAINKVLREDYGKFFEYKKREDTGMYFICCTEDAPEELKDLIFGIHYTFFDGCLPNDWIYENIRHAFEELKHDKLVNVCIEADAYNSNLYTWLGNPYAADYCDEILQGFPGFKSNIWQIIGCAQSAAKQRIYEVVEEFIESEEEFEEEEEEDIE